MGIRREQSTLYRTGPSIILPEAAAAKVVDSDALLGKPLGEKIKMTNTITFNKVTLVKETRGLDRLSLECEDADSPFPELEKNNPGQYPLILKIECAKGYAERWCDLMDIKIDTIIEIP